MRHRISILLLAVLGISISITAMAGINLEQTSANDLNKFAVRCAENKLWKEAEFRLRKAIEIEPDVAKYHNNLAVALEAQGKLDEAYAQYVLAQSLDLKKREYKYNLNEFVKTHKWVVDNVEDSNDDN